MTNREFDVVIYGATGFTGQLVAEYIAQAHGGGELEWAMAGRNLTKLEQVRSAIDAPSDTPLIVADADAKGIHVSASDEQP